MAEILQLSSLFRSGWRICFAGSEMTREKEGKNKGSFILAFREKRQDLGARSVK